MLHVHQRLQAYRFFSQLFRYPDAPLIDILSAGKCLELSDLLAVGPPANDNQLFKLETLEELYTGLFIARPGGVIPLYGSVFLDDGKLMGASSKSVLEIYSAHGLSLGKDGEPPDYLSTELEFLYYLVNQEIELLAARKPDLARQITAAQKNFVNQWLLPWLEPLAARVGESDAGLYHWGAATLLTFIQGEKAWLDRLVSAPS